MTHCSLLEGKTKEGSTTFCNVCKHRVYDMKQHLKTEEHRRNLRRAIRTGVLPCPHCGGRLEWDEEDGEWCCINCGRRSEGVSVNNNRVSTDSNPISTTETPPRSSFLHRKPRQTVVSTGNNLLTTGDNRHNYARKPTTRSITTQSKAIEKIPVTPAKKGRRPSITALGPENIYKGHAIEGAWWSPGEITFRHRQMLWLIEHLPELREGQWPANPVGSGYIDLPLVRKGKARSRKAYFEIPTTIVAEVEVRLEKCGIDGLILLATECWGESEQSLAKYLGIPPWSVRKRANNALRYISGWERKNQSYKEFLHHRKVKDGN